MNQQDRYLEVLNYIDANLDRELDLQVLADVAHISRYHFHRQFSGFVGMSVMALCKKIQKLSTWHLVVVMTAKRRLHVLLKSIFL